MKKLFIALLMLFPAFSFAGQFELNSVDFGAGQAIPIKYTCHGDNVSPGLLWRNAPPGTKYFAVVVQNPDYLGRTYYNWLLYNIPANIHQLPDNSEEFNSSAHELRNFNGGRSYTGPCPPAGETHSYVFTVYALRAPLHLGNNPTGDDLIRAAKQNAIASAQLQGTFTGPN
jgi:Raf kinase inhibitor-like YbhB/YbcL family protein